MSPLAKKALAEFTGTFALVLVGCGVIMVGERFPGAIESSVVPVVFGLVVAAMIYSVGHISGAHFNPAVTLGFAIGKHFPMRQLGIYWAAQFLGAIAASALLSILMPGGAAFGTTELRVGILQGVVWEALLTFLLMFVIVSVATDTRAEGTMAGVAIGSAVALGAFLGGPLTGASMNPARSLAPALFSGHLENLWVFFVGPAIGAMAAVALYSLIRCDEDPSSATAAKGCC